MPMPSLPLDHIAIAVHDIEQAIKLYVENFGYVLTHRETLESEGLAIAFIKSGDSTIELISPVRDHGPVVKFLEKRGPGMHHVCLRTPNLQEELDRLAAAGFRLIDTVPRAGARGKKIAFVHPSSTGGVLLELCEVPS